MATINSPEEILCQLKEKCDILYQKHRFKEIEEVYDKGLPLLFEKCSQSSDWYWCLATAYNNRGHSKYMQVAFDEALEDYNLAIKYHPMLAIAYYNRATIHYRLCQSYEVGEKIESLERAMSDFKKAIELEPENEEFGKGYASCKELLEDVKGDGNCSSKKNKAKESAINLKEISNKTLVKLLFSLDNGDKSTDKSEFFQQQNIRRVQEGMSAFMSFMKNENISEVREVLEARIKELYEYPFFKVPVEGANEAVRTKEQEILTLIKACKTFGVDYTKLKEKELQAQKLLFLSEAECQGSFLIYAENLRIIHVCDVMSEKLVYLMYEKVRCKEISMTLSDKLFSNKDLEPLKLKWKSLEVSLDKVEKVEGFKEALFFCIIRMLEMNDLHNRLYTNNFEELLQEVNASELDEGDTGKMEYIIDKLSTYPNACQPTGYCLVFCVTNEREGAESEIRKVKEVFEKSLGFTVKVVKNPTLEHLQECRDELEKFKYHFYDSLVFWFMSHGNKDEIKLGCGEFHKKNEVINSFCKLENFRKKPKLFFMCSCQGEGRIEVRKEGSIEVTIDGQNMGDNATQFADIPGSAYNITAVYYEMDRLIAHATLPDKYAFRMLEEGSIYVDTVCRLLEKYRGKNITTVLEKANNKVHQIIFSSKDNFEGKAKQACYYESTFQKTFIVPSVN
ncbi:uncharacterized protein [Palaemon carinicauda]|uniref:uncharacterized protein n=1 Tax=Palaemon carinicauda TaxID=392227 RepID=UPI0035B5CC16